MTPASVRLAEDFEADAARCTTKGDLLALVSGAMRELGFDYFALLHHASLAAPATRLIRLDNYPADWVAELAARGLVADDPVHLASARSNCAFRWEEIASRVALTARHRDVLERGRRHGIGDGFTVPANVPGEPAGSCTFAVRRGRVLPARRLSEAEVIAARAFWAARRLSGFAATASRPHLSRREVQCLRLVAAGKTDWEIGRLLGISEATARQYVKRARSAYDVVSRTQLVVRGLRDAWIAFDDAIPPFGGMG